MSIPEGGKSDTKRQTSVLQKHLHLSSCDIVSAFLYSQFMVQASSEEDLHDRAGDREGQRKQMCLKRDMLRSTIGTGTAS